MPPENFATSDEDAGVGGDIASALADIHGGSTEGLDDDEFEGAGAGAGDAPTEIADDVTADGSAGQAEGEATPDAAANAAEPPSDFTADEKEAFSKLTPEAQALVASYSNRSQVSRTTTAKELDGLKKQYGPIGDVLKPYEQLIKQAGTTADKVVGGLLPYYHRLVTGDDKTKRETIEFLAQQFGVEMGAPKQPEQTTEQQQEFVDPDIKALKDEIARLEGLVTKTSKTIEDRDRMTEQQRLSEAQAQIDAFRNEKDEKGNLKRPHYEKLEDSMLALMQGKLAKTLEEAYVKAARLDPDIQALEEKAKADAKRAEDAKKAADAKKASAANRRGDGAPGKQAEAMDIPDAVRAAYDEISASV